MVLTLLLASNNHGKIREYRSLLHSLPLKLVTPTEAGIRNAVAENGKTMAENARLKAVTLAAESRLPALADDSGLEVDALGGEPGVLSARYAGENASDRQRIDYLLQKLAGVPSEKRTARFRCVIAIALPDGRCELCSGECSGIIPFEPRGKYGFGYDPIFYVPEYNKTMAELPISVKNQISHRAVASRQVPTALRNLGLAAEMAGPDKVKL